MMTYWSSTALCCWRRLGQWGPRLVVGGACALAGLTSGDAQEPYYAEQLEQPPESREDGWFSGYTWRRSPYYMQHLSGIAAQRVSTARGRQVRNGQLLDRTIWNYHFEEKKAELLPSGVAMLNRLARIQVANPEVEVFVATAHDLPYNPEDAEAFAEARDQLDSLRARSVRQYLQLALRRPNTRILLCDPAPVGMVAEEAAAAYRRGLRSATSVIPPGEADAGDFGPGFQPGALNSPFGGLPFASPGADPFGGGALPPSLPGAGMGLPAGDANFDTLGVPMGDAGLGLESAPEPLPMP